MGTTDHPLCPFFAWGFLQWLKYVYYDRVAFGNTDREAEDFYPKFREYWVQVIFAIAQANVQRYAISWLHVVHALVLTWYCFTFAFYRGVYNRQIPGWDYEPDEL